MTGWKTGEEHTGDEVGGHGRAEPAVGHHSAEHGLADATDRGHRDDPGRRRANRSGFEDLTAPLLLVLVTHGPSQGPLRPWGDPD